MNWRPCLKRDKEGCVGNNCGKSVQRSGRVVTIRAVGLRAAVMAGWYRYAIKMDVDDGRIVVMIVVRFVCR